VVMFGVFFPLAGRFAGRSEPYTFGSFAGNLLDLRCLPLFGILAGLGLNLVGVPRPGLIERCGIIDILVVACTAVMFFVTGLRLHASHLSRSLRLYLSLGLIKFMACPLLAIGLIRLVQAAGLNLGPLPINVMIVESFMPMALFAVAVANLYGLDAPLASSLFVANTAMFLVLVLPVLTFAVRW
ncbi:MAG: AEC family transporter, partial [Phycisphaerae bacterium]